MRKNSQVWSSAIDTPCHCVSFKGAFQGYNAVSGYSQIWDRRQEKMKPVEELAGKINNTPLDEWDVADYIVEIPCRKLELLWLELILMNVFYDLYNQIKFMYGMCLVFITCGVYKKIKWCLKLICLQENTALFYSCGMEVI